MDVINSSLTFVNEIDVRGKALRDLIGANISFPSVFYGFKPLGANPDMPFPVLFVEPKEFTPTMTTTQRWNLKILYNIFWYVRDNEAEQCVSLSASIAGALVKLFSNNALGDLSGKYFQYPNPSGGYYWLMSEMGQIRFTDNFLSPSPSGDRFERGGRMQFRIEDENIAI